MPIKAAAHVPLRGSSPFSLWTLRRETDWRSAAREVARWTNDAPCERVVAPAAPGTPDARVPRRVRHDGAPLPRVA
jgi:hypothetical protein